MEILKALNALRKGVLGLFNYVENLVKHKTDRIVIMAFTAIIGYHIYFLADHNTLSIRDFVQYTIALAYVQIHYRFGRREKQLDGQETQQTRLIEQNSQNALLIHSLSNQVSELTAEIRILKEAIERKDRQIDKNNKYVVHLETRLEALERETK